MPEFLFCLRQATRVMRRAPGFSMLSVAILAIGIGATTLMFSLVQAVLLRDLPFEDPDRLVWMYNLRTERDRAPLSLPDFQDYRRDSSSLAGLAVFTNWTANLTGAGWPERLEGTRVSGNFFQLLGVRPALGRALQQEDEDREARVTVLTHGLWIRRFGADAHILGRGIFLNGTTYTVVGILPERFLFPFREAEVAVPLVLRSDPRRNDRGANFLRVVARLAPGVTVSEAKADLDRIAGRLQRQYPLEDARKVGISLYPLHAEIVKDYRSMLWMLFGSVGVLLVVGCMNLANLLSVRAAERQTELAVRLSLGASRGRLVRQLLGETAMLAFAGGVVGIGLAAFGLAAWQAWGPPDFPQMADTSLDRTVLFFAVAVSCFTALGCGVVPAWFASGDVATARGVTRASTAGSRQRGIQRTFVGAQMAASTVLLAGMGLMAQALARLERVAPGFTPDQTLSVQLSLPPNVYANRDALVRFFDAVRDRLSTISGVERAGVVSLLPLSGLLSAVDLAFPDRAAPPPDEVPQAHFRVASPEYFAAAGIPLLEGRAFTDHDRQDRQPVAIVSRTFAMRHWPGESAVGKSVQIAISAASPPLEIVGVVSDVKHFTLDGPPTADLYVPLHQMPPSVAPLLASRMYWMVRSRTDRARLSRDVREAVSQVDPGVAASSARTLEAVWSASLGPRRLNVKLLQFFGAIALGLSAIGVYGVAAFSARTRRRELAIRAALGASSRELTLSMLRRELVPVVLGLGIGLAAAYVNAPLFFGTTFETNRQDTLTYVGVAAVLLTVAIVATYVPIRRAGATNPAEALNTLA
jgi:putative ABC transport system permease protein